MANRRAFGQAMSQMASFMQQMYLQQQARKNQLEDAATRREQELTDYGTLRADKLGDEAAARERERLPNLLNNIGGANSLTDLGTPTERVNQFIAQGGKEDPYFQGPFPTVSFTGKDGQQVNLGEQVGMPIRREGESKSDVQRLLESLQSRRGLIDRQQQATAAAAPNTNPDGSVTRTLPGGVGGRQVVDKLGASQLGKNQAVQSLAGELSPEVTQGKIAQSNAIEEGTRGAKVETETALTRAATNARLNVELSPEVVKREIDRAQQLAVAQAAQSGQLAQAKEIQSLMSTATQALVPLSTLERLYNKVKTEDGMGWMDRTGRSVSNMVGQLQNVNSTAAQLNNMREGLATMLYSVLGGKGVVSDKDRDGLLAVIPSASTEAETAAGMFAEMKMLLSLGPIAAQFFSGEGENTITMRLEQTNRWMDLLHREGKAFPEVPTVDDPETGLSLPNPYYQQGVKR